MKVDALTICYVCMLHAASCHFCCSILLVLINGPMTVKDCNPRVASVSSWTLLQVFVPYANASTTNETAKYLDSHLVHTGQFFSTDAMNTYVGPDCPTRCTTPCKSIICLLVCAVALCVQQQQISVVQVNLSGHFAMKACKLAWQSSCSSPLLDCFCLAHLAHS